MPKGTIRKDLEALPLITLLRLREIRPDLSHIIRLIIENRQPENQEQKASAPSDPRPPSKKPRPPPDDDDDMPRGDELFASGRGRGRGRKGGAQGDPRRPIFDWLYNHGNGNEHLNLLVDLANEMPHNYDIDLEGDINEGTFANIPLPILIQGVNAVIAGWGGDPYPHTGAGRRLKGGAQVNTMRSVLNWLYSRLGHHQNILTDLATELNQHFGYDIEFPEEGLRESVFANIPVQTLIDAANIVLDHNHKLRYTGINEEAVGGMTDPFTWGYNLGHDVIGPALFGKGSISDLPAHEAIHHGAIQPINQKPMSLSWSGGSEYVQPVNAKPSSAWF